MVDLNHNVMLIQKKIYHSTMDKEELYLYIKNRLEEMNITKLGYRVDFDDFDTYIRCFRIYKSKLRNSVFILSGSIKENESKSEVKLIIRPGCYFIFFTLFMLFWSFLFFNPIHCIIVYLSFIVVSTIISFKYRYKEIVALEHLQYNIFKELIESGNLKGHDEQEVV